MLVHLATVGMFGGIPSTYMHISSGLQGEVEQHAPLGTYQLVHVNPLDPIHRETYDAIFTRMQISTPGVEIVKMLRRVHANDYHAFRARVEASTSKSTALGFTSSPRALF